MNRARLLELARRVAELSEAGAPVLVGSQALHGAVLQVPASVSGSFEADFLLDDVTPKALRAIGRELGAFSDYQDATGTHADPVRKSILTLPYRWERRLIPLADSSGTIVALCLDRYDVAVTKIAAGREKDWVFIRECAVEGIIEIAPLLRRCEAVQTPSRRLVVARNLKVLTEKLASFGIAVDPAHLARTLKSLERPPSDPSGRGS